MKTGRANMILRCLRRTVAPDGGPTDGQLLTRYVAHGDSEAFAVLVRRHGPMILAVCRRVLRHAQDAEDAFQAAFFVLSRKAASVGDREAVAGWLYKVAYHAALAAKAAGSRRKLREQQVQDMPHPVVMPEEDRGELLALLDRELARLPEKHRLPLVLCELEGRSRKEAARQLGVAEGTLSSRLARGRALLARRLAAHGAAVAAASLAALSAKGTAAAFVPAALVESTVRAAGATAPAGVAALAKGVMKIMLLSKLKCAAWTVLMAAALGVGVVFAAVGTYQMAAAAPPAAPGELAAAPPLPVAVTAPPAPGTATPPLPALPPPVPPTPAPGIAAGTEMQEIEALAAEVQALRASLEVTRQRVKALEEQVRGAKPRPDAGVGLPGVTPPVPEPIISDPLAPPPEKPNAGVGTPAYTAPDPTADVEAALAVLRRHPGDRQALDELGRAVKRLQERAPQSPAISPPTPPKPATQP